MTRATYNWAGHTMAHVESRLTSLRVLMDADPEADYSSVISSLDDAMESLNDAQLAAWKVAGE